MSREARERAAKGGRARASKLTPEERRRIGIAGSVARWGKKLPSVRYGSPSTPLRIGEVEIACYVLDDRRRVMEAGGVMAVLGIERGDSGASQDDRLAESMLAETLPAGATSGLSREISTPILFRVGETTAYGYDVSTVAGICTQMIAARGRGELTRPQERLAHHCETLVREIGREGMAARVDRATGMHATRARDAAARSLEESVRDELKPWLALFPAEFYEHLYRLEGLDYPADPAARLAALGTLTDDIVFDRLERGPRESLEGAAGPSARGAAAEGDFPPRLREHLACVVTLMRISDDLAQFQAFLDRALPRRVA